MSGDWCWLSSRSLGRFVDWRSYTCSSVCLGLLTRRWLGLLSRAPRRSILGDPGKSYKASDDLASEVTACHFWHILLVKYPGSNTSYYTLYFDIAVAKWHWKERMGWDISIHYLWNIYTLSLEYAIFISAMTRLLFVPQFSFPNYFIF